MLQNYRFNIFHPIFEIDYRKDFSLLRNYLRSIIDIVDAIKLAGATHTWYFLEPYLEITYLCESDKSEVVKTVAELAIKENFPNSRLEYKTPNDGQFADWYCNNEIERYFGAVRHDICYQWIKNYNYNKLWIDNGKGLRKQVERTIHTLCNPLGLNYKDEAKICFSRGLICLLFWLWPKRALWIYRKIFRQNY